MIPKLISIVDFIGDVIETIKDTSIINDTIDNEDGTYTCLTDTKRLQDYYTVLIDGSHYLIKNVTSVSFDITISADPIDLTWKTVINYYYGDPKDILNDLNVASYEYRDPIVALFQPFQESINLDNTSPLFTETSLWMAFVRPYQDEWLTSEHYTYSINPMNKLLWDFITELKNREGGDVQFIGEVTKIEHSKYGIWNKTKGHETEILQKVSGIEIIDLDIQLRKKYLCKSSI